MQMSSFSGIVLTCYYNWLWFFIKKRIQQQVRDRCLYPTGHSDFEYRITEWSGLEGTSVGHPVQPSRQSRVTYSWLQRTLSRRVPPIPISGIASISHLLGFASPHPDASCNPFITILRMACM